MPGCPLLALLQWKLTKLRKEKLLTWAMPCCPLLALLQCQPTKLTKIVPLTWAMPGCPLLALFQCKPTKLRKIEPLTWTIPGCPPLALLQWELTKPRKEESGGRPGRVRGLGQIRSWGRSGPGSSPGHRIRFVGATLGPNRENLFLLMKRRLFLLRANLKNLFSRKIL